MHWPAPRIAAAAAVVLAVVWLTSCSESAIPVSAPLLPSAFPTTEPTPAPTPVPTTTAAPSTSAPQTSATTRTTTPTGSGPSPTPAGQNSRRGTVVVLDPGHNGRNAAHPEIIQQLVDAGFGRLKPCNTVGTQTAAGYPEHAFAFDVAVRARRLLAARGLTVLLTRPNDTGVGPCVDQRGRFGNRVNASAVVSIHADGALPTGSGFHVIEAAVPPAGPRMAAAAHRLALAVRAALRIGSGFGYANYRAGGDGLDERSDLAGLNLSTRPSVVVECGNMRNPSDAAKMTSPTGRQRIAQALAAGVIAFLAQR